MKASVLFFAGPLALAVACGGSDNGGNGDGTFTPDAGSDARATSSSGQSSGQSSGASGSGSGGTTSSGGSGSSDGGSSGGIDPDGGGSSSSSSSSSGSSGLPPQCHGSAEPGTDLGVILDFGEVAPAYVTVAEDGLSVAWVTGTDGNVDVFYADRDSLDGEFGAPQTLHGNWAVDRVGLGTTGLILAVVRADRFGFDAFRRTQSGEAFVAPAEDPLLNVNEAGADTDAAALSYGDPVFAHGDAYFVFSRYGGGLTQTLLLGSKLQVDQHYSGGTPFTDAAFLNAVGGQRRRPVALSDDARTFFYFDEVDSTAYVTSRNDQGGAFTAPVSLGARLDARPISDCGSLVFRPAAAPTELHAVSYE